MNRRGLTSLGVAFVLAISLVTARTITVVDGAVGTTWTSDAAHISAAAFGGAQTVALPVEQLEKLTAGTHRARDGRTTDLAILVAGFGALLLLGRRRSAGTRHDAAGVRVGRSHPARAPPTTR